MGTKFLGPKKPEHIDLSLASGDRAIILVQEMVPLLTEEEAQAAEKALLHLPTQSQSTGQLLLREQQIQPPNWDMFESGYRASIQSYYVSAAYSRGKWSTRCSCSVHSSCEHAYALLWLVIAHYGPAKPQSTTISLDTLSEPALQHAIGRRLSGRERQYLRTVHRLWNHFQMRGTLVEWDLYNLGLCGWSGGSGPTELFGHPPKSAYEFWLHLAHAMHERRADVPDFLVALSDFSLIAGSLEKLKRDRQITFWQNSLGRLSAGSGDNEDELVDIRLRVTNSHAQLESRRDPAAAFEPLKKGLSKSILQDFASGRLPVVPECSAICEAFARELQFGYLDWALNGRTLPKILNLLLRVPMLQDRIVNAHGVPFARSVERVKWKLEEVPDAAGDVRLSLALPDGANPGEFIIALDGRPPLYLFENTLFAGPPFYSFLTPGTSHVVPGPILESQHGVEFLYRLGVELPRRLQHIVERVQLRPRITCSLSRSSLGSGPEMLTLQAAAFSENGRHSETLGETGWTLASKKASQKKAGKIVVMDRSALKPIPALVAGLGAKWDWYSKRWQCRVSKSFPEKFLTWLASVPSSVELLLDPVLDSLRSKPLSATLQLDCTETEIDWFDLKVSLNVPDTELTPEELKLLLNARGQFVRLKDKGWRRLDLQVTDEDDQALARLGLTTAEFSSEPQRLHALQLADDAARKFLPEQRAEQIRRRAAEIKTRVTPALPATVQAQLRPYQLDGFHFLAYLTTNRFGGILADDMGLGKTVQTLTWLEWVRSHEGAKRAPSLVVCPKSVMETWRSEAGRFVPGLRVKLWRGTDPDALPSALEGTDLLVLNYAQLRSVGDALTKVKWQAAILDEGQYIKNPDSQTAQTARALPAQYRLALSGTPIENRLLDLWSLMAFAMPGVLGNRAQFARQFNINADPLARRRLAARVRPFLLRRTKSQVAKDLPERVEEDLLCELEGEQKTLYRAEFKHAQQMLLKVKTSKELNEFRFHFLTSLSRLRQICCHPALISPEFRKAESAKLNACMELLEPLMEEGHKVLVFSQFVSMLDILQTAVEQRKWQSFYLAGDTENRGDLVNRFQNAEGAAIFLISLKAGGFGLNLTAASYVVLFDPWWNPAVENQAIDRTHRIGQTRKVMAYRLLMKESIEEKIRALQRAKSAIAEDILGEENFAKSLTLTDLQFLFSEVP